jgi:hypothetical protein
MMEETFSAKTQLRLYNEDFRPSGLDHPVLEGFIYREV